VRDFISHWIDGPVASRATLPVYVPARGAEYARLAAGHAGDVEQAVAAAIRGGKALAALNLDQRARLLEKLADRLEADLERFAQAECWDAGKPITLCREIEIPRAVSNLRFFASAARQFGAEAYSEANAQHLVQRSPLGVVATISPWNLPLYLFTWKIAPALAAGNAVIAKPSEVTPLSATMLAELAAEVGFPAGALSVLHGRGADVGAALVSHREVKAVSFTGSTATGRAIALGAAPHFKKLSLELGGKNPTIICADADLDVAVPTALRATFQNQGQICLCGSRIFIERSVFKQVREQLIERALALKIGDPAEPTTQQGALVSREHLEKIESAVARAHTEGGRVLCGGTRLIQTEPFAQGWYFSPTLIDSLPFDAATNQEEIFGPVATLIPFDNDAELLAMANSTPYGLAASVWTQNFARAQRLSDGLHAGLVWINCWMVRDLRVPFGGVKQSGLGREGGFEAMRFFTDCKAITWPR
jgi:aminomuconate-semialdehyde/2-hydroxymuconate-6-semialdehyde dehydrogenase